MQPSDRISIIKNTLYSEKKVTIAEMAAKLNVTYPTIRKDFHQILLSDNSIKKYTEDFVWNLKKIL